MILIYGIMANKHMTVNDTSEETIISRMGQYSKSYNKRILWVDIAKGICITLIILDHCYLFSNVKQTYPSTIHIHFFIYAFYLPVFFFLSGMFFKIHEPFHKFTKKRFNKLLLPFIFFYSLFSVCIPYTTMLMGYKYPYIKMETSFIQLVTDFYTNDCQLANSPLWFLLCLFEIHNIFFAITYYSRNYKQTYILSTIIGVIGLLLSFYSIKPPLMIDTSFTCLPFFCLGFFFRHRIYLLFFL